MSRARERRALVAAALGSVALIGAGLLAYATYGQPREREVRGTLLEVHASSIVVAESIELRDESGAVWTFSVDPSVATNAEEPQSAAHLRQHMIFGDAVVVRFTQTPTGPRAYRIVDAPGVGR